MIPQKKGKTPSTQFPSGEDYWRRSDGRECNLHKSIRSKSAFKLDIASTPGDRKEGITTPSQETARKA